MRAAGIFIIDQDGEAIDRRALNSISLDILLAPCDV
jgi:hypothetical protein